jgi:hypothetical protein
MAKDPSQRYPSAGDLGRAATAVLDRMPPADPKSLHPGLVIPLVALCTAVCIAWFPPPSNADRGCWPCNPKGWVAVFLAGVVVWPALLWLLVTLTSCIGGALPERARLLQERLLDALALLYPALQPSPC